MRASIPAGLALVLVSSLAASAGDYAVVVSRATRAEPGWSAVVDELARKHGGEP